MVRIYAISRPRRIFDLMVQPWLAILGIAFPAYTFAKLAPLLPEGIAFLRRGGEAWIAAAPLIILIPFLVLYLVICARVVFRSWRDAWSTATKNLEGRVTHVSTTPFAFNSGNVPFRGTINHLGIEGRLFSTVPKRVITQLQPNELLRIGYTPRADYVVSIDRIAAG